MEYPEKANAPASDTYPGTPGWVKAIAVVAMALILVVIILHLTGHGMEHHKTPNKETQQTQQP